MICHVSSIILIPTQLSPAIKFFLLMAGCQKNNSEKNIDKSCMPQMTLFPEIQLLGSIIIIGPVRPHAIANAISHGNHNVVMTCALYS